MLRSDNKIGQKMDLNSFFLAKTKCIIYHLESSIIVSLIFLAFKKSENKSIIMDFRGL